MTCGERGDAGAGPGHGRGAGRTISAPAFPDDDGSPDEGLRSALLGRASHGHRGGHGDVAVLAALRTARLLVPVVAVLDEAAEPDRHGLAGDKQSSMAAVLLAGRDGRRALLAFTGLDTLLAWDPQARPVAVSGVDAARSAVAEGAAALLLDLGSPTGATVQGADLQSLAAGLVPVALPDGRSGWLRPPAAPG